MANVTVSVPTSNITVDTTNSIVNVASTTSNVTLSSTAAVSNADVRQAISVSNVSGFGNLAYDSTSASNGIIQYTGVSTSDIRTQITGASPIIYSSASGEISLASAASFIGKTTDDLPEGTTNKYFTTDSANAAILDYEGALPGITTLDASGNISLGGNLNITRASAEQVFVNGNSNDLFQVSNFDEIKLRSGGPFEILGSNINLWADSTSSGASTVILGNPTFLEPSSVNIDHNIRSGGPLVLQGGYASSMNQDTQYLRIETVEAVGITPVVRKYADFNQRGNANIYLDPAGRAVTSGGFKLMNNANTSVFSVNHLGATTIGGSLTVDGTVDIEAIDVTTLGGNATTGNINIAAGTNNLVMPSGSNIRFLDNSVDNITANISQSTFTDNGLFGSNLNSFLNNKDVTFNDMEVNGSVRFDNTDSDSQVRFNSPIEINSDAVVGPVYVGGSRVNDTINFGIADWVVLKDQDATTGQDWYLTVDNSYSGSLSNAYLKYDVSSGDWFAGRSNGTGGDIITDTKLESYTKQISSTANISTTSNTSAAHGTFTGATSITATGNVSIGGNLNVTGNINSETVVDLLVEDRNVTLQYGQVGAPSANSQIFVDRGSSSNTYLLWDEGADKWKASNDGTTEFVLPETTTDLTEGTNLYYTDARFNTAFSGKTTDDLAQGSTNKYFTTTGATVNTDALTEGSTNLYYSNTLVADYLANGLGSNTITTTGNVHFNQVTATNIVPEEIGAVDGNITIGKTAVNTSIADEITISNRNKFTVEQIREGTTTTGLEINKDGNASIDIRGFLSGGGGENPNSKFTISKITADLLTVDINGNTTANGNVIASNFIGDGSALTNSLTNYTTSDLAEGTNLYYTDARVNAKALTGITESYSSTDTNVFKVDGDGYALFGGNRLSATSYITYSGTADLKFFEFEGSTTSGDANITVSAIRQGDDDSAATVADLAVGYVLTGGTTIFDDDVYVTAIDTGTGNVTMSSTAIATETLTYAAGNTFTPGLVDTDTGLVMSLQSTLQTTGSGSYTTVASQARLNIKYGYPQRGPQGTDFDIAAVGSGSDYSFADLSDFTLARTNLTPANTVIKANQGIVVGENTDLTNRGENDVFSSFGVNIMWDGLTDTGTEPVQPAMLFKSYTDNAAQSSLGQLDSGAPRLFFTTANGKSTDNPLTTYPRTNQELGRLSFWGSNGQLVNPSSYNVPAYMSVQAADNWDTWGGGVGGNTDVYYASTSNGVSSDTYLAYKAGELYIAGGGDKKPITFLPAQQPGGSNPQNAYAAASTTWANINYADTSAPSGAELSITNGASLGAGTVGDMNISLNRLDNSTSQNGDLAFILSGSYITSFWAGRVMISCASGVGVGGSLNGETITMSPSGTITTSSSGNETALGGNSYGLTYAGFNGSAGGGVYFLTSGGSIVTYSSIGGTDPISTAGDPNGLIAQTTPSYIIINISSGVTAKEYKLSLEEQSANLKLVEDSTTLVEFSGSITDFSNRVKFKNHTSTEILALSGMTAGEVVYNSTDNLVAYYDGTNWRNIAQGAIIT
jgi:hypothetical protein